MKQLRIICLFVGLLCGNALSEVPKPSQPNIILILADDLGLPALGSYGGIYKTTHLDRLAAGGTRFELCFSAPLGAPSRSMLRTVRLLPHQGR